MAGRKEKHLPTFGSELPDGLNIKGRIWIEKGDKTFIGLGRVALLESIKKYGSITKAAKSMGMSYRHAWQLIDSVNEQAGYKLVEASAGGKNGGGSIVTEAGEEAIKAFKELHKNFKKYLKENQDRFMVEGE